MSKMDRVLGLTVLLLAFSVGCSEKRSVAPDKATPAPASPDNTTAAPETAPNAVEKWPPNCFDLWFQTQGICLIGRHAPIIVSERRCESSQV